MTILPLYLVDRLNVGSNTGVRKESRNLIAWVCFLFLKIVSFLETIPPALSLFLQAIGFLFHQFFQLSFFIFSQTALFFLLISIRAAG
jgi:hypothetical protein